MFIQIDLLSPIPVYEQIINRVEGGIATGALHHNDRLPSIRDLAVSLRLNRNTVARAYMELERRGLIRSHIGQGSFICADHTPDELRQRAESIIIAEAQTLFNRAAEIGITPTELAEILNKHLAGQPEYPGSGSLR